MTSVLEPNLVASILARVQRIAALIGEAGYEDTKQEGTETKLTAEAGIFQPEQGAKNLQIDSAPAPNLALGAIADDDDDDDAYLFGETQQHNTLPSSLAHQLATEATGLRDIFSQSRQAISSITGGDLSIKEQQELLLCLEAYSARQEYVGANSQIRSTNSLLMPGTNMVNH